MPDCLLEVKGLKVSFKTSDGLVQAVDDVSFKIRHNEILGIVGESGCGKSVTALSIMKLVPIPPGQYLGGQILFQGEDLIEKTNSQMQEIRGNEIAMIFQEPMTSLNPVHTIGSQVAESIILHQGLNHKQALSKAEHMLSLVGIPDPHRKVHEYPHQLSGGMRQRAMIAMALSCNPKLLIADEPTTALDVTIQAQILELIKNLKHETGMAIMLITHDLGVIAEMADRVIVMYAGKVVEEASVKKLFRNPFHPYTVGLHKSTPRIDRPRSKIQAIEGSVPEFIQAIPGCRFNPRCPYAEEICEKEEPFLLGTDHKVACHFSLGASSDGEG